MNWASRFGVARVAVCWLSLGIAVTCANGVVVLDEGPQTVGGEAGAGQETEALPGAAGAASSLVCPAKKPCEPRECTTPLSAPSDLLVTDFENVSQEGLFVDNDAYSERGDRWWLGFYGSPYVYPTACPPGERPAKHSLTSSISQGELKVDGTVGGYSGFGLWLGGSCAGADLSASSGIEFTLSGVVGPSGTLTFSPSTTADSRPQECVPNVGTCSDGEACRNPFTRVPVTNDPTRISVSWSELTGGYPVATADPRGITSFNWSFDWRWTDDPDDHAYAVAITLDDVRLIP